MPRELKIDIFDIIDILMTAFFDDFPKIPDHFSKNSEDLPNLFRRPDERSRTFFENFRRLLQTFEDDPKIFRSCTSEVQFKRQT